MTHRPFAATIPLLAALACARPALIGPADVAPCVVATGDAADTILVGVTDRLDLDRAPVSATNAERLAFAQLYHTLVTVDCAGAVRPALAESWESHAGGERWTIRLRPDARFWDGTPVTADAVYASWMTHADGVVRPWRESVATSVTVTDRRTLVVELPSPAADPRVLAHPSLAVTGDSPTGEWPHGTGPYGIVSVEGSVVHAAPVGGMSRDRQPVIAFIRGGRDGRDLLDRGVHVLVTGAPHVVDYARRIPQYRATPLPWDRVYALVVPSRLSSGVESADGAWLALHLARDVIGDDARAASGRYWWSGPTACGAATAPAASLRLESDPRVVYPAGDATARAIAERVVALGRAGELGPLVPALRAVAPGSLRAVALGREALEDAARRPTEAALVLPLELPVLDACVALDAVTRRLGWIDPLDLPRVIVPLVEARRWLIVRDGAGEVHLSWDGVPLLGVVEAQDR